MTDEFTIKSHSNKVLDLKGNTLQSSSEITIKREGRDHLKRPDDTGSALLQALHLIQEAEDISSEVHAAGVNLGDSALQDFKHRAIKIHYYAWGLFKKTIIKAIKDRQDLKEWSPEIFADLKKCDPCNGKGIHLYPIDSPQYKEAFEDMKDFPEPNSLKWGVDIGRSCRDCGGVGVTCKGWP